MKRSRLFLILIIVLLLINSLFFIAWYAFDMQGVVKGIVEREAGKALAGEFKIRDFSISDRQVFAEYVSFTSADSSLAFNVESLRVRFNLFKFLFSGFKIKHLLNIVELHKPHVSIILDPEPEDPKKPKKAPSRFELPDLTPYFNHLSVTKGSLYLDIAIPLQLGEGDFLIVSDEFSEIEIKADNTNRTKLSLKAISSNKGVIDAKAELDRGRIALFDAEISNFSPRYAYHPAITDFGTEISLVLKASQKTKKADLDIEAKAFLWNTRAVLLSKYPVNLPFIVVETDGNDLDATISRGSVGSSVLGGQISLTNLQKGLLFKPSQLDLSVDLAMIDPNLKGIVSANVSASGSIEDPTVKVRASSPVIAYDIWQIQGIRLDAELKDDIVEYTLSGASWENQSLDSAGSFDLNTYMLTASLETHPLVIDPEGLMINAAADIELSIYDIYPEIKVNFTQLDVESGSMAAKGFSGNIHLIPATHDNGTRNYYVNCDLTGKDGHHISVVGDILDRNLLLEANFGTIALADFIPADAVQALNPKISGSLNAFMLKDKIIGKAELNLSLEGDVNYHSDLSAIGSYDISSNDATLYLEGNDGILNGESLEFELVSSLNKGILNLASLRINDQINLSGSVDLNDTSEYAFNMTLKNFDLKLIESFYPPIGDGLPDIKGINITAIYNLDGDRHIALAASADSILIDGIVPMSAEFMLKGPPGEILISGFVSNMRRELISLKGEVNLNGRLDIDMTATMNSVFVSDVVQMAPVEGAISASVNVNAVGLLSDEPDMVFTAKVTSPKIIIPEVVDLEDIHIEVRQTAEILYVDSLYVRSDQLAMIQGSGALDYNVLSGTIFDGSNHLSIRAEAELFHWLTKNVDMVTGAGGYSSIELDIGTKDDQLFITSGKLEISDAHLKLENQVDTITDINILGTFENNRLTLDDASLRIGGGKLTITNQFDDDPGNHFFMSILDLGSFNLLIDEPGIQAAVPIFTAPRTLTNIRLRGQNTRFATVEGPFDDMKIKAEVLVSNASVLYPPDTDNLLRLIYTFRSALSKDSVEEDKEPLPLPFTLDLMIRLQENVSYVTYPANLQINAGGFVHILYDGLEWSAKDASFTSEQGTIDFFGTVFQADYLAISIIGARDILTIQGSFYRRAPDGTVITLSLMTDSDSSKPFFDRLIFKLSSDNPQDQSITQILGRLRSESDPGGQGEFQDEALSLISNNLNTSLLTPILYPVQNRVRRMLRLDSFTIKAGFIQNLFTQYSNDPDQMADYMDMQQFMGDITQFSSSILLNNLSISMSKYLGRKIFLDYELSLQEATDLQKKTKLQITHDTTLRMFLPRQFRLAYTFKYEPTVERLTHEVMLQRSFRFWGL